MPAKPCRSASQRRPRAHAFQRRSQRQRPLERKRCRAASWRRSATILAVADLNDPLRSARRSGRSCVTMTTVCPMAPAHANGHQRLIAGAIQCAGRFIGQNDFRAVHKSSGNIDPLRCPPESCAGRWPPRCANPRRANKCAKPAGGASAAGMAVYNAVDRHVHRPSDRASG